MASECPFGCQVVGDIVNGCFNPQAWSFDVGKEFDEEALKKVEHELQKEWISGSSILGR